jgi:HEAT repeat protein/ATP/ADP translocase
MARDKRYRPKNKQSTGGLGKFFKVESGEGRVVLLLGGAIMAIETGYWMGGNGLDGLVFARFGSDTLPYLLILKGILTFLSITLYTRWLVSVNRARMLNIVFFLTLLVLVMGRLVIGLNPPDWFFFILWPLGYIVPDLFQVQAWALAGEVFDNRQTKRLFPLIAALGSIGVVAGNFLTYPMAQLLGSANLLLVWVATVILAFAAMFVIRRRLDRNLQKRQKLSIAQQERIDQASVLESLRVGWTVVRYYQIILLLVISTALMHLLYFSLYRAFVDSTFDEYQRLYPNEQERATALTGFFGLVGGGATLVAFIIGLFFLNRLYTKVGVRNLLMIMPITNVAVFGALIFVPGFPTAVGARIIHLMMTQTFSTSVNQTIYNLLPPEAREAATPYNNQGISKQGGVVLAGLLLLLAAFSLQLVLIISLVMAVIYLLISLRMRALYRPSLVQLLREGQQNFFSPHEMALLQAPSGSDTDNEKTSEDAVHAAIVGLDDSSEGTRRLSAELLGQMGGQQAIEALTKSLLRDTSGEVRRTIITSLVQLNAKMALPNIAASLNDKDPPVRAEAAMALRQFHSPLDYTTIYYLGNTLTDRDPMVRREAALTLLANGRRGEAMVTLWEMGMSEDPQQRREAAAAYGAITDPVLNYNLTDLIDDFNPEVRRQAASSLGKVGGRMALKALFNGLDDNDASVREEIAKALAEQRTVARRPLLQYLHETRDADGAMTALQALTLAKIAESRENRTRQWEQRLSERRGLMSAARRQDYNGTNGHSSGITTSQEVELLKYGQRQLDLAARMAGYLGALSALEIKSPPNMADMPLLHRRRDPENMTVLLRSLKERYDSAILRAVGVIGLLGDAEALALVATGLQAEGRRAARMRADAIEALENFGDPNLTPRLIKLLEGRDEYVMEARRPGKTMSEILTQIWHERDAWLQACVLHVIGLFELRRLRPLVAEAVMIEGENDYLIEDTGMEALKILDGRDDDMRQLLAQGLLNERDAEKMQTLGTLSTMSRIMFLQKVPIFANLRPEDLRRVALVCKERTFVAGDIICYEGDPGDEMYIVVAGKIQVLTGVGTDTQRLLAVNTEGEAVGYLSILDDIPRSATLRAHGSPVRLLILSADEFKRILRERPEMAAEVIRVLSRMLRETNRRLQETPAGDNLQLPQR